MPLVGILFFILTGSPRAQSLEIVFKNSLWGAGIGAAAGMASWAMTEDHMADELRSRLIQGGAIGALFGVGYGVLEAEGVVGDFKSQEPKGFYLVEWSKKKNLISINPLSLFSKIQINSKEAKHLRVFRAFF